MVKCERKKITIPTYPIGKAEALPIFYEKRPYQGASGKIYPIPYVSNFSNQKVDKEYDGIELENEYIKVLLLPEIGGKIHSALDKTSGYDFIYNNKVIKPAMVGLAGPWVSGGIEFNWPQHHRPTTFMPVDACVGEDADGKYAYMGEFDYFYNMKGMVKITVDDKHSYIKAKIRIYNSTPEAHPFMWWANLAVEVNQDYKIVFPPDVEYVNDHDRRAVLEWPIAKGVYKTARPFDYGTGTDIHSYSAVKVPCSFLISKGQSDADFVSGYDAGKRCGIVTVANHHVSPGKKLWTWGDNDFGAKWCANLTDDGSKYVELMTGCYTDNQPDFTYIQPYETKEFEQYWYPVKDIGETKYANIECALNVERTKDGIFVGVYSTSERKNCKIVLSTNGETVYERVADISPKSAFTSLVPTDKDGVFTLSVFDETGNTVATYTEYQRGQKTPIEPRLPALDPKKIETVEELYLNGRHLMQYKHFAYRPEDYFNEALLRDPLDSRSNLAMAEIELSHGDFKKTVSYCDNALKRLNLRNFNPQDTTAYYLRALAYFNMDEFDKAYEDAYQSVWSYSYRSSGYYLLAKIENRRGNKAKAIEFLRLSLETNTKHLWAKYILGILEGDESIRQKIATEDPLFFEGSNTPKNAINFAIEYTEFGLYELANEVLENSEDSAIKYYHLAYIARLQGKLFTAYIDKAENTDTAGQFPSRKESIKVLTFAGTPMANYYKGCILYNFERWKDAADCFELSVKAKENAPALRNLSFAYFDHLGKSEEARKCLERAFELFPCNRIFYEVTMLYKSMNLPLDERLAFFEKNANFTAERDDCTLNYSVLCTEKGDYARAREILNGHSFHTYEGGEGNLTTHHTWLCFLIGKELFEKGDYENAKKEFLAGLTFPKNYGEEKNYFVNDAPIYYYLALCEEKMNDAEAMKKYLLLADTTKGVPTIHTYYQVLALKKLGKNDRAEMLAKELIKMGENKVNNAEINDYYGVGAPVYPPFGYDVKKAHEIQGYSLMAFGYASLDNEEKAKSSIEKTNSMNNAEFSTYLFTKTVCKK